MRELLAEYQRSLKAPELEELLDWIVFRPLGFVTAKLLLHAPVSADHVSLASLAFALVAGALLWVSPEQPTTAAAVACYFACAVLDCADGQLARLRKTASPVGYIVDGSIDYAATLAVFAGVTRAVAAVHPGELWPWLLGLGALAAMGWHSAVVDRIRHAWLAHALGRRADPAAELQAFRAQADAWKRTGGHLGSRALVAMYLFYRAGWARLTPSASESSNAPLDAPADWASHHRPLLRVAMLAGPSAHMTAIMVAALAGHLELYLAAALVIGVPWTAMLLTLERGASRAVRRSA